MFKFSVISETKEEQWLTCLPGAMTSQHHKQDLQLWCQLLKPNEMMSPQHQRQAWYTASSQQKEAVLKSFSSMTQERLLTSEERWFRLAFSKLCCLTNKIVNLELKKNKYLLSFTLWQLGEISSSIKRE